ncbi:hypothetical protein [Nocardia ninae]|uniref:hypothetical protein n=1 Tax=Nocardia ninae TaxID=356145 RepID=UPI0011BF83B9|nr:hypothetical protein [Nocardia ninae]
METDQGVVTTRNYEDGFTLCRWLEVHASGLWALLNAPERSALAEVVDYGALRDLNLRLAFMRVIDAVEAAEVGSTEQYRQQNPWSVVGDPGHESLYLPDTDKRMMPIDGYVFDLACSYIENGGPDLRREGWWLSS